MESMFQALASATARERDGAQVPVDTLFRPYNPN